MEFKKFMVQKMQAKEQRRRELTAWAQECLRKEIVDVQSEAEFILKVKEKYIN